MFKIGKSIQKLTTKLHNTILQETYLNQNKLKWSKAPTTMKLLHPPKTTPKINKANISANGPHFSWLAISLALPSKYFRGRPTTPF